MATVWFLIIGLLIAVYAMLDGFDLGIGVLYPFIARNEHERSLLRASIGPVWDGNEVWLLAGGGALFAAFPPVYAMTFSGFYLAIMLVLFGLIVRAVSLEFRHQDTSWSKLWDATFFVGSLLPALLFGVAVGNIIRGVPIDAAGDYAGSFWALLNPFSLLVGVLGLTIFLSHGAAWLTLKAEGELRRRAARLRSIMHWTFMVIFVLTTVCAYFAARHNFDNVTGRLLGWIMLVVLIAGIVLVRWAIVKGKDLVAFFGSALSIIGLVGLVGAGNYPNLVNGRGSAAKKALSIHNSASGHLTLTVMLIVAIVFCPIVIGYTIFVYRKFAGKVKVEEGEY